MINYILVNRELWNERTELNIATEYSAIDDFKKGITSLRQMEACELGSIAQKKILHLQCHFGLDALSFARQGAIVTGLDFSQKAIDFAKTLSEDLNIPADFICSDVYDDHEAMRSAYDIVYTSYGVLCWLPDLSTWAQRIASYLKNDGFFYIIDLHPLLNMIDTAEEKFELSNSYFYNAMPKSDYDKYDSDNKNFQFNNPSFEWQHSISDVLNALISQGLTIEFIHEFPFCFYQHFKNMTRGSDGWWYLNDENKQIPLMFSIKARK